MYVLLNHPFAMGQKFHLSSRKYTERKRQAKKIADGTKGYLVKRNHVLLLLKNI